MVKSYKYMAYNDLEKCVVILRQQDVWCRAPYFLSLKVLYRFWVGNRAVAYSALYHNLFSGIAVHETWHGTSVDSGSHHIRARGQTHPIHPGPIRTDLVEWIDPLLYALVLSSFFLTGTFLLNAFFFLGKERGLQPMKTRAWALSDGMSMVLLWGSQ